MIFIVAGMHRSGTSLLGGLLHTSGISMGSAFRNALPENAKGFFEDEAFKDLNDRMLGHSGYRVKEWSPAFAGLAFNPTDRLDAAKLIGQRIGSHENWGWKDPRSCLTLPFWIDTLAELGLLSDTRFIVARRQRQAVIASLQARGNFQDAEPAAEVIEMYERNLFVALAAVDRDSWMEIWYDDLLCGGDVARLTEFCGTAIDRDFIDASLNHWSATDTHPAERESGRIRRELGR
jgi:hypothetical protein